MAEPQTQIDIKSSDHEIRMSVNGEPFGSTWGPGLSGEWFAQVGASAAFQVPDRADAMRMLLEAAGVSQ